MDNLEQHVAFYPQTLAKVMQKYAGSFGVCDRLGHSYLSNSRQNHHYAGPSLTANHQ